MRELLNKGTVVKKVGKIWETGKVSFNIGLKDHSSMYLLAEQLEQNKTRLHVEDGCEWFIVLYMFNTWFSQCVSPIF